MKDSPCARETLPFLERKDELDNTYKAVLEMGEAAQVARNYDKVLRPHSSCVRAYRHDVPVLGSLTTIWRNVHADTALIPVDLSSSLLEAYMHGVTRRRLDISRPMRYHIDGVNRPQVNFIEVNAMRQFEEGFFVGLSKLERVYKRYFQEAVAEFQFTPNEITVLMFLCNNAPALDTATDIARFKRISKGLVARSVDSLTRRGLLSAQRDERDRRIVHLALSENCAPIAQRLRESERALFAQIAEGIDPVRLEITSDTLRKINQNMNRLLEGETVR